MDIISFNMLMLRRRAFKEFMNDNNFRAMPVARVGSPVPANFRGRSVKTIGGMSNATI
jgi:hypothetical protein